MLTSFLKKTEWLAKASSFRTQRLPDLLKLRDWAHQQQQASSSSKWDNTTIAFMVIAVFQLGASEKYVMGSAGVAGFEDDFGPAPT